MRCLQCGKDLPLFKRFAGSEFCSDGHRREYQREYSQLALGRLLQSKPSDSGKNDEAKSSAAAPATTTSTNGHAVTAVASVVASAGVTQEVTVKEPKATGAGMGTVVKKTELNGAVPTKSTPPGQDIGSAPAIAEATSIQKPAPATLQTSVVVTAELERAFSAPSRSGLLHQASMSAAVLPQANPIRLERCVGISDLAVRPMESKLELRDSAGPAPRIGWDLRIIDSESLETHNKPVPIPPISSAAPAEAVPWTAPHLEFGSSIVSLGNFANLQFSTSGFEEPRLGRQLESNPPVEAGAAAPSPATVESHPGGAATGWRDEAPPASQIVETPIPELVLRPLPMAVQGIAGGKAKPVQVFGFRHFEAATALVPKPSGLPLRPVMVLRRVAREATPSRAAKGKSRRPDVRILPPAAKPSLLAAKPPAAAAAALDLGLPELRLQSPQNHSAAGTSKIVAAVAGAAVLAIGLAFLLGNQFSGNPRQDTSKRAVVVSDLDGNWITNFATDAPRGRKISILRSSVGLADYRLEFESSIQIKGLGWVYRAQDPKNFYVSKIELEKAGLSPRYVMAHYAVIGGIDQPRTQEPLHVAVPLGGHYKIRFEAAGDRFTTWLEGQRVDQWTDAQLKTGGAGLYKEGAEQFTLHGDFRVAPLSKDK